MRVGTIAYASDQGIAMLAKSFYNAGVVTDIVVYRHHSRPTHMEWYPEGTPDISMRPFDKHECVHQMLKEVDVMLFFETPFDWEIIPLCKQYGVKTAIMPMYECTPEIIPHQPDRWICPSLLDMEYFPGGIFRRVPVDAPRRNEEKIRIQALRFLHNGGNLGLRGHKGTLELLQAVQYTQSPIHLTIRAQDIEGFNRLLRQVPSVKDDKRVDIQLGNFAYETLFDGYDVLVAPEKYNGLSLPLQEARAAGMVVMTSDRFPHNTWLPQEFLIPVSRYHRARVGGSYKEYDEAIIDPMAVAAKIDEVYGQDISQQFRTAIEWGLENSWEALRASWLEALTF